MQILYDFKPYRTLNFGCLISRILILFFLLQYGKQLRENYRAFRSKQGENVSKDYNSYSVPNVSEDVS